MQDKLIVTTTVPGRHRGGAVFTGANEFELDHFSDTQFREILADPVLTVSVGRIVARGAADAYLAQVQHRRELHDAAIRRAELDADVEIQSGAAAAARADTGATSDAAGAVGAEHGVKIADANASSLVDTGVVARELPGAAARHTMHRGTGTGKGAGRS